MKKSINSQIQKISFELLHFVHGDDYCRVPTKRESHANSRDFGSPAFIRLSFDILMLAKSPSLWLSYFLIFETVIFD